jgi:hypothetical protein
VPGLIAGAIVGGLLGGVVGARADGGLFFPMYQDLYEPAQIALLVHDADAQREELYLQVGFEGTAPEFGWVVPVPSRPEVSAVDRDLFWECHWLTEPVVRERGLGCGESHKLVAPADGIEILEDRQVGIYRAMVVGASDAGVLADSLTRWGYLNDENRARAETALQFYVDRSWYFVLFRVAAGQFPEGAEHWSGELEPIGLSFASAEPIYPLRISALSAAEQSEVLLYVRAGHRMTFPGARTEYVNHISASELQAIRARMPRLGPLLCEGSYLTKLRRTFRPSEMTDDLVLQRAETDDELRRIYYSGIPALELLLLGGLIAGWGHRRRRGPGRPATAGVHVRAPSNGSGSA